MSSKYVYPDTVSPEFRNFAFTLVFCLLLIFILTTSYFAKKHIYVVHSSLPLLVVAIASSVTLPKVSEVLG